MRVGVLRDNTIILVHRPIARKPLLCYGTRGALMFMCLIKGPPLLTP
jgi:hypothetical protein